MELKKMSRKELETRLMENRVVIRETTDAEEKRNLINENHEIMAELDARWAK